MAIALTKGVASKKLDCGCQMSWKIAVKSWNDFARVDISSNCTKSDHKKEMAEPWKK